MKLFGWLFRKKTVIVSDRELELLRLANIEASGRSLPVGTEDLPSPTNNGGIQKANGRGLVQNHDDFSRSAMIQEINKRFEENKILDERNR
jgi:hypothetical protein